MNNTNSWKRVFSLTCMMACTIIGFTQSNSKKPKLVVGIVVDQLRYDLLTRFEPNFSETGFKRLLKNGFFAENMHYNYVPTYTGPGHSSIYTGSVPAIHGIAANNWLENGVTQMYCTQDASAQTIGAAGDAGKMSPKNLKVTTVTDQLKLFTNNKSKVYGVALKDRGAILPAGHTADAAYWYDSKSGYWISSSYYIKSLPSWLENFNNENRVMSYMKKNWNLLLPPDKYIHYSNDLQHWEEKPFKNEFPTFPYTFREENYTKDIRTTPYGNSLTTDVALAVLRNEKLGQNSSIDFLAISYSSTDYIGHAFGPYSLEIEDCYYRLDQDISKLLYELDSRLGKENYWLFLTADHGVQDVPSSSLSQNIPAGNIHEKSLKKSLNEFLLSRLNETELISDITNEQLYLRPNAKVSGESIAEILNTIHKDSIPGIKGFYYLEDLAEATIPKAIKDKIINGYYRSRSGSIGFLTEPGWMCHGTKGTTHGSPYSHDSHIPFIFFGSKVKAYRSAKPYYITDIAPSLSYLLDILQPNGCIGNPMVELEYLKNNPIPKKPTTF